MLMCVKYKVVSVCYIFGFFINYSLLYSMYITFCFVLFIYINMYYCTQRISKSWGFKTCPSLCRAELFKIVFLFFFKANLKYKTLQKFYVKKKKKKKNKKTINR